MRVYMIQPVAAVHIGWGQAPSLDTENDIRVHSMDGLMNTEGATWAVVRAFWLPNGASVRALLTMRCHRHIQATLHNVSH